MQSASQPLPSFVKATDRLEAVTVMVPMPLSLNIMVLLSPFFMVISLMLGMPFEKLNEYVSPILVTVTEPFVDGTSVSPSFVLLKETVPSYFPINRSLSAGSSSLLHDAKVNTAMNNRLKILIVVFICV